ncbi:hypothetical protein Taro_030646, partial [Colocasia esculenta]|nr:hypothetical protein [Colocasia esculenta]
MVVERGALAPVALLEHVVYVPQVLCEPGTCVCLGLVLVQWYRRGLVVFLDTLTLEESCRPAEGKTAEGSGLCQAWACGVCDLQVVERQLDLTSMAVRLRVRSAQPGELAAGFCWVIRQFDGVFGVVSLRGRRAEWEKCREFMFFAKNCSGWGWDDDKHMPVPGDQETWEDLVAAALRASSSVRWSNATSLVRSDGLSPITNFFVFLRSSSTICGAYLKSSENLASYSTTVIDPCVRERNSCSILSWICSGTNLARKSLTNASHATSTAPSSKR